MIDCPCGFGKNLKEDQDRCPVCDMELRSLHEITRAEEKLNSLYINASKQNQRFGLLKKIAVFVPVGIIALGFMMFYFWLDRDEPDEITFEQAAKELETSLGALLEEEGVAVDITHEDEQLVVKGDVPTGFHREAIAAIIAERFEQEQVDLDLLAISPPPELEPEPEPEAQEYIEHEVKPGESLSIIAQEYYGDYREWVKIYRFNEEMIIDYDEIDVGQVLKIPVD